MDTTDVIAITLFILFVVGIFFLFYFSVTRELTQEEIQKLYNTLPEGCEVFDVGRYGKIDNMVVVNCVGKNVTTSMLHDSHGKTHEENAVIVIE